MIAELRARKAELTEWASRRKDIRNEGHAIRRRLRAEMQRLSASVQRLGETAPDWAVSGMTDLQRTLLEGRRFCADNLNALDAAFERVGSSDELQYISEVLPPSPVIGPTPDPKNPLHLFEPPHVGPYLTLDGFRTVVCETYRVFDTVDTHGLATDRKAVIHAEALLRSQGHAVVLPIGSPGLPDLISVDPTGRLWISEIKGTDISRPLPSTGLRRTLTTGPTSPREAMFENAPVWLSRVTGNYCRVDQVLDAVSRAIETSAPGDREALQNLRENYREAARQGFSPLVCGKQLIQIGFQMDSESLKPPSAFTSKVLDEYIAAVEPSKIVQMEVLLGSAESEAFDALETDAQPSAPTS
jgi:hypothetical protein